MGFSLRRESRQTTVDGILIFLLGLFVFTVGLTPEFVGFQARFAVFAQEMFRNGPSFFPTTYGHPYADYPAGSIFLIYLASLPFGRVTPFSTVLPSAAASALVLVLTYRIGALRSRQWGLAAALFAVTTVEFLGDARSTALDQYVSLATVLSFYWVYSADQLGRPRRLWFLPLAWILGFVFRGPMGAVIPVSVACVYCLWNGRFRQLVLTAAAGAIVLALCVKGLLIAAQMQGGQTLAQNVLSAQVTGRVSDRGPGFSYYWLRCLSSYALSYPLAVLVIACHFRGILRRTTDDDRLLGSLAIWVLTVLVGLSIPSTKHTRYLLPIVPAISLVASYLLIEASPKGALPGVRRVFERVCSNLPLPVALVVAGLFGLAWGARYLLTAVALILLLLVSRRPLVAALDSGLRSLGICAAVFAIVSIGVVDPINYSQERTKPFVGQVEALQERQPGDIVFFRMGPDQEDIKFAANASKPIEPRFIRSFDELKQSGRGDYIVAEEPVFQSLPAEIGNRARSLLRGKIGHESVVVFTLAPPS
jgi:4-amino-4-deoxy-L-arabinose transferase-like glycosyltransferase